MADRPRPSEEGAVLNVRISAAKMATLKHLSSKYEVSVSSIISSLLAWAEAAPEQQQDWFADVEALRNLIKESGCERQMIVEEITRDEWPSRKQMCDRLQAIGYIDSYNAILSRRDPSLMICSYKLTTGGWIIANALALAPSVDGDVGIDQLVLSTSTADCDVEEIAGIA